MKNPRILIIGRPNVGKSTLFNRLLKKRVAIIHPQAGVTRDRKNAEWRIAGKKINIIDTGGIFPDEDDHFSSEIFNQVNEAVKESDYIIFVVEATGITGGDQELAEFLRKTGMPVLVVANKSDKLQDKNDITDIYSLGFSNIIPVSAEHGRNTNELKNLIVDNLEKLNIFKKYENIEPESSTEDEISFALIGRPNVGKSSILNKILQQDRSIVSHIPGTTRDSVEEKFLFKKQKFSIIDTAGLRRKRKVRESIEFYSTLRSKTSISRADVTVLLIEPETLITEQDKKICDIVLESGKSLIFVINKWDTVENTTDEALREMKSKIRFNFPEMSYIPILTMSAITGRGIKKLLNLLISVKKNSTYNLTTPELNKFVSEIIKSYLPSKKGKQLKIYYAVQSGSSPPKFTFFVNNNKLTSTQYKSYIINNLRKFYDFTGVPIFIQFRDKK